MRDGAQAGVEVAPGVFVDAGALRFSFVASGGPGGQNVNKRATKAELRVALAAIPLAPGAIDRLRGLAASRVNEAGELVITADEHRSQGRNRDECLDRLRSLIVRARVVPKVRRGTRPTRGSVERRLEAKRARSHLKRARRPNSDD